MRSSDPRRTCRSSSRCGIRSVAAGLLWLAIGTGALCACASGTTGTGASPTPSQSPTATAQGTPTPASASPLPQPVVLKHDTGVIKATYTFDFETGAAGSSAGADVWWQQVDSVTRYLVPQNGALLARLGETSLEVHSASELVSPPYSRLRIDGSNSPSLNQLTKGTIVAIRTRHGHYARMRIDAYGVDLFMSWITYQ